MRHKYRSAVYTFSEVQKQEVEQIIATFQELSEKKLITQVLTFQKFKASRAEITNYYYKTQRNHSAKAL
jgi:peptide-methionine (S)-S-oxide reductase